MNTDPLPPCPVGKRGRHRLCAVMPEHDDRPVLLFCDGCGMTARHSVDLPVPMDDLTGADIERLAKR